MPIRKHHISKMGFPQAGEVLRFFFLDSNGFWTVQKEMETDDDHATMKGSQSRFVNYVKFFLAFSTKNNIYDVFFQL